MKKKTALQQLIEQLESMRPQSQIVDFIKEQATELLETEREDHEKTYYDAFVASDGTRLKADFDEYYKETYG